MIPDTSTGICGTGSRKVNVVMPSDHEASNEESQPLLPKKNPIMTDISNRIMGQIAAASEDPFAPHVPILCGMWDCVKTIAGSEAGDETHHGHSDGAHDPHIHTEPYKSATPLEGSKDRCSEPCLNDDGTVCTEIYRGTATRGHSHM
jgi:hypothetical protein